MYTWGYIKDSALAKLDVKENEANVQDFLNRFPIYANEVITQVTSSIKPKHTFFTVTIENKVEAWEHMTRKYNLYKEFRFPIPEPDEYVKPIKPSKNDLDYEELLQEYNDELTLIELKKAFWKEWNSKYFQYDEIQMPEDFVSFGDDVCTITIHEHIAPSRYSQYPNDLFYEREANDSDFTYQGYNKIVCQNKGVYKISYNARWYTFTKEIDDNEKIDVPEDILDCIPSYIASQCWKIDDEYKSSVFKNEYETFLARIDDTNFKNTKTFSIKGDW